MRKILSFLMMTLFSVSMFAAEPVTVKSTFTKATKPENNKVTDLAEVVTWDIATTVGQGEPTYVTGQSNSVEAIKFGGSKSVYFSKVEFSTDYFNDYNVTSVNFYVANNGKKTGTLTVKQGSVTIGTSSAEFGNAWTTLTATGTKGEGGSLTVTYEVEQAFYLSYIEVTYEEKSGETPEPEPTTKTVYCKVAQDWWKADGAATGIYAYATGNVQNAEWPGVRMTAVEGETDLWKADIDTAKYDAIIFTRVNASGDIADWGAKTADLVVPADKDLYTITSTTAVWGNPGVTGTWSVYGEEQGGDDTEQVNYYMTGEKATNWVGGWEPNDTPMHGDSAVFKGLVPGTRYQFKITGGSWGNNEKGFNFVNHASRNAGIYTTGDGGNIMFYMNQPGDVKVKVVGDSINVEGNFVHYFLAGNGEEGKAWAGGKGWWQDVAPLAGDSIVYDNLETEVTYEFKVLKYASWNNAMNINNVTAASKALGVKGNDNITFEMAEAGKVVIRVVGDSVALTGNFVKPAEPADPVYAISGAWNNFEKDLFVVAEDKKTASFSIDLEAGDYEFKIRKDDAWLTKANGGNAYGLHREWTGVAGVTDEATENLKLTADVDGKYTFVWTFANDSIGVVFPAKPVELQAVSEATTWDFSKITANKDNSLYSNDGIRLTAESTPNKNEEVVYANYSADFMTFAEGFDATTMAFKGEYPIRKNQYCQAGTLHFKTTVAGKIVVKFSDTGSSASATAVKRYLVVNGEQTEYWTSRENNGEEAPYAAQLNVVSDEIAVPAGDVTITGSSAIVMYYVTFTPAAEPTLENGFYLIGKIGGVEGWNVADLKAEQKFAPNLDNPVEFMLDVTLAEGDELKVVNVLNNEITAWFPGGESSNFNVTAAYAGEKTVYFRPDQQGGEGWHYGCIYIAPNQGTGISNTAVEGKAVKMIMDGQLLIIRNGKTYNVQGQQLK